MLSKLIIQVSYNTFILCHMRTFPAFPWAGSCHSSSDCLIKLIFSSTDAFYSCTKSSDCWNICNTYSTSYYPELMNEFCLQLREHWPWNMRKLKACATQRRTRLHTMYKCSPALSTPRVKFVQISKSKHDHRCQMTRRSGSQSFSSRYPRIRV